MSLDFITVLTKKVGPVSIASSKYRERLCGSIISSVMSLSMVPISLLVSTKKEFSVWANIFIGSHFSFDLLCPAETETAELYALEKDVAKKLDNHFWRTYFNGVSFHLVLSIFWHALGTLEIISFLRSSI